MFSHFTLLEWNVKNCVVKALWNALLRRHKYSATSGSICCAALLNDIAPDSELSDTSSSPLATWVPGVQGTGGHVLPDFCEANVKSLILTIGAPPPDLYCVLPVLLMFPPSFHSHRAPMAIFIVTGRPAAIFACYNCFIKLIKNY